MNVILIHCHDLGRWLSCYGMPSVPSPHVHAFANQSVVFDNAFATAPLCSPARGSLFTGLLPHRHGVQGLAHLDWRYREKVSTIPEMLRPHGYHSTLIGLQHEHPDATTLGFDDVRGSGYLPRANVVADTTTTWLRDHAHDQEPYFLTVGMWEVHRPWPPEDYIHADPAAVDVPPYLPDNGYTRADIAAFHGAIRQFDEAMGRIFDAIDTHTAPASTMVIVTTDHGAAFPRAKGTLYDPGVEVALIVRPPTSWDVTPGRSSALVSHLDISPTMIELAGGTPSDHLDGRSLAPAFTEDDPDRTLTFQKTYHDGYDPIRALRTPDYKYIRNFADRPALYLSGDLEACLTRRGMDDDHLAPRPAEELYDLRTDPWEQVNLVSDPAYAEVRAHLSAQLDAQMKESQDPLIDADVEPPSARSREVDALPALG